MANGRFAATQGNIATGTGTKTLMELATTSTVRATVYRWWVEFQGTTVTAEPIEVQLARATAAITGTAVTEVKLTDYSSAPQTAAVHTATAEGTVGDVLETHAVHPTSGIDILYPYGREVEIPVSGFLRIRTVSPSADVQAMVGFEWEE